MEFMANLSDTTSFILWVFTIVGHIYITDLLVNNEATNGQLCFTSKVSTKTLIACLLIGIMLEVWACIKILLQLAGQTLPIKCFNSDAYISNYNSEERSLRSMRNIDAQERTKLQAELMSGGRLKSMSTGGKVAVGAFAIIGLFFMGSNLYIYSRLIESLSNATEVDGKQCIQLTTGEVDYMKVAIYFNWFFLIVLSLYSTWVDFFCQNPMTLKKMVENNKSIDRMWNQPGVYDAMDKFNNK